MVRFLSTSSIGSSTTHDAGLSGREGTLLSRCQFSPVMSPSVFGQSGPLPEVTLVKLLTKNEQTIVVCQGHDVDSIGTSFWDWGVP